MQAEVLGWYQAQEQLKGELLLSASMAHQLMLLAQGHHVRKLSRKAAQAVEEWDLETELHGKKLRLESDIAQRETIRDEWNMKNTAIQTQLVVESLFFSLIFELFISARVPDEMGASIVALAGFMTALGVALVAGVASLYLLLVRHYRLTRYDLQRPMTVYRCGAAHASLAEYYTCHCARLERVGHLAFAASTSMSVLACCILALFKWQTHFLPAVLLPPASGVVNATSGGVSVTVGTAAPTSQEWSPGVIFVTLVLVPIVTAAVARIRHRRDQDLPCFSAHHGTAPM